MDIDAHQAEKLCSALEFELFKDSQHPEILAFSEERIRKRIKRALELCELWQGRVTSEKQRVNESPTASTRRRATTGYVTAEMKATLFGQVLARFETRLAQMTRKTKTIPRPLGPTG